MAELRRRDAMQIAYHWVNFLAIASLTVTGLGIYLGWSGTSELFAWHLWAAWVLMVALLAHLWYDVFVLKRSARMLVSGADVRAAVSRLKSPSLAPKHGHYKFEQIVFHWLIAIVVLGLIVTGLILWKPARMFVAPFWLPWGWDAIFVARILHDLFTFLIVAMVIAHVYFALIPKNRVLLRSMFHGRVDLEEYAREHRVSPRLEQHLDRTTGPAVGRAGQVSNG